MEAAGSPRPTEENRDRILQALKQWPQNQESAINQMKAIADEGDPAATVLVAFFYLQAGRVPEGVPYAKKAVGAGSAAIANNYWGQIGSGDPEIRKAALEMLPEALDAGWPIDPLGNIQQLVTQGEDESALELIDLAVAGHPPGANKRWDELIRQVEAAKDEIAGAADSVGTERDRVIAQLRQEEEEFKHERERISQLVDEVEQMIHRATADHLAQEYAAQAKEEDDTADKYTVASLVVGGITVLGAIAIAIIVLAGQHGVGAVLSKAALTLPGVAFTGYLGGLARSHRHMSWHWRHVELQIRASDAFIAPLDDDLRKTLLAALALRFFPGQTQDPQGKEATPGVDPSELVAQLVSRELSPAPAAPNVQSPPAAQ